MTTQVPATKRSQVRVLPASIAHRPRNVSSLSSHNVLAFPDLEAAISGSRKFRLVTNASEDGLGVVIGQQQPDGSFRLLRYIRRTTLDNERKWTISELEGAAIVQAIRRNRKMS